MNNAILPTDPDEVHIALKKNETALQDIEHMITSLHDVRSSVHHIFHLLQGRTEPLSGEAFREQARYTYTALECLTKLALNADALLNDTQALELPKLQGPSPVSLEAKQKEAQLEEKSSGESKSRGPGQAITPKGENKSQEYLLLSIDDTIRWFTRSMKKAGRKVSASKPEIQPSSPFATVKTSVWEESSHLVFKKITQIAVGAIDHFMALESKSLLGLVLEWISNYATLFTAPCAGCGKHLFFDSQQFKHLPPTLYTYDKPPFGQPYHLQCHS
ncbi:hypothetical protein BGZ83_012147 [Gryganskiella cystojenkinii]|nr:hypothetical protein BGZ83_012147 [Gryganskiella cystojenkinii]